MEDKISAHFSISGDHASCHCGCGRFIKNDKLVTMLEKARVRAGIPFKINSWCRCQTYNDSLPNSVPDSEHIDGRAVDIRTTTTTRQTILFALRWAGFKRIGKGVGFLHVDISETKPQVEWTYK
jgi:hypothetical protein